MQLTAERLQQIEHIVRERQHVRVAELSQRLGVSEPTIRRDLQKLEEMGRVQREHGGASAIHPQASPEPPIIQRAIEHANEKRRIGRVAADLIKDGETIFLGSGTTTLEVARHLEGKRNLTVITNALNIANQVAGNSEINLIITGGIVRHSEASMIGHIVEQTLKELRADKVIVSMRALGIEEGLTNADPLETVTDRVIIQFAREVILVADSSKFSHAATGFVAPITAVHRIITDDQAAAKTVSKIRSLGIDVILA
jgi:DeoR/GlpR family transcriptional regulator of sugar metabolism